MQNQKMKNQNVIAIANEFEANLEEERFAYLVHPYSEYIEKECEMQNAGVSVSEIKKESQISLAECIAIGREYLRMDDVQVLIEQSRLLDLDLKHLIDGSKTFARSEIDLRLDILSSLVQPNLYMEGI